MTQSRTVSMTWPILVAFAALVLALGLAAGWLASRAAMGTVVRDYVLENPEILPQAMENLRKQDEAKQLAAVSGDVKKPFPGAVLGNPNGKIVLVEFADYACGYCRQSVEHVNELIAQNPELKVVVRELPILSPQSADAARMALAAAEQGKYPAFHSAMYAVGGTDQAAIEAAAQAAGVDLSRARQTLGDPRLQAEIDRNMELARQLGFQGTPSWVVGDRLLSGADKDALAEAIAEAKG